MKKTNNIIAKVVAAMITLTTLASCGHNKNASDISFKINGDLANGELKTLYITEMTADNGEQFIDSIKTNRYGKFRYKGTLPYLSFICLHVNEYEYIVLIPENGDEIELTGDYNMLKESYLTTGSTQSQLMWQIQAQINSVNLFIHDLAEQDNHNKETLSEAEYKEAHEQTDEQFKEEFQLYYTTLYNFIEDNLGSLSTLFALDAPFNHTHRVFYKERDMEVFEMVLDGLQEKLPNNPHTQYFKTRVERARSAAILSQSQI